MFYYSRRKMSRKHKVLLQKSVSSLFSISNECVVLNLPLYSDSLKTLPIPIKERILRKLLRTTRYWKNLDVNKTLSALIYPHLKQMDVTSINVDNSTLQVLEKCGQLSEINLRHCDNQNISSAALCFFLEKMTNLQVLDVAYCKQFNDTVLECLSKSCGNLCELCAEGCNITDEGIAFLAQHVKKIKCLTISDTHVTGDGIASAVNGENWRYLQELRLDSCFKVNNDVLQTVIENCPKIEILTFYNCAVTDETAIFQDIVKTCKKLKQLHWTITW